MGSRWQGLDRARLDARAAPLLRHAGHDLDPQPSSTRASFTDIHCGMRGITRDALERMDLQSAVVGVRVRDGAQVGAHGAAHRPRCRSRSSRTGRAGSATTSAPGWFSPWQAAWINLRAMFVYGSDFFVFKPGIVLMVLGLLLTLPAQLRRPPARARVRSRSTGSSSASRVLAVGCQAFFLGCIAQVLFDYTGRADAALAAPVPVHAHACCIAVVLDARSASGWRFRSSSPTSGNDFAARAGRTPSRTTSPSPASPLAITGAQLFVFTLLLHGTVVATTRAPARECRGVVADRHALTPVLRPARAPVRHTRSPRGSRSRSLRSEAVRSGAHEMAFPISTYAPWQADDEFRRVPTRRFGATRWSTSGAATSSGASSASCATCRARSSRSACGGAAPAP